MDDNIMEISTCESNDQEEVMTFKKCEQKTYKNSSHMVEVFEVLQSLRKDKVLCDIRIDTDDGTLIFGHKNVLISACPYFREIFTGFNKSNIDHINIRQLHSTVLELLINYIYTGEIIITKGNVKVLLVAANLLQLDYVKNVCTEFLQTQLDASNCLGIKAFADLHDCMELATSSKTYIKNWFLEVVNYDEFLCLTSVEVIELISCNDIFVPLEEKVFECVIHWLKHELDSRKDLLPELMEHVRWPLISKQYLLEKVVDEPLLKFSPKCKDFIIEALQFHLLKPLQPFTVLQTIRSTLRQSIGFQKLWVVHQIVKLLKCLMFLHNEPCWIPMMDMLIRRGDLADLSVGTFDICVYAIGGRYGTNRLNSVEVFDIKTNKWQMVTSMSTKRSSHGVGVGTQKPLVCGCDFERSDECIDFTMYNCISIVKLYNKVTSLFIT